MDAKYITLYIGDVLLEDDKLLMSYALSYHCHVTLCYNNPNIEITAKYMDKELHVTIDCNKSIQDLVSLVYNVVTVFCSNY